MIFLFYFTHGPFCMSWLLLLNGQVRAQRAETATADVSKQLSIAEESCDRLHERLEESEERLAHTDTPNADVAVLSVFGKNIISSSL